MTYKGNFERLLVFHLMNAIMICNDSGIVHKFARSALRLVLLDSHKTYCI